MAACANRLSFKTKRAVRTGHRTIWIGLALLAGVAAPAARAGGRILTAMDVVAIRVVDHPELDWMARVEPDGTISFPYLGRIKAAGRSEDGLARAVERGLIERKIIAGT